MADFINTIDVIGDDALADSIISRNIIEYKDNIVTSIGGYAFGNCTNLTSVDFPVVTSIDNHVFQYCTNLTTLILRNATMCRLNNKNAFSNTAITNGTGYIYVPRALVDSYKSATNWSTYASVFRALEDYPEICGGEE